MRVLKKFRLGGRWFLPGQQWRPERLAVSKRVEASLEASGRVGSAAPSDALESPPASVESDAEAGSAAPTVEYVGGGWYEVTKNGETRRVRGREEAEALLEE